MNSGFSTVVGWCAFALAGGTALFFTRREYLARREKQMDDAYISSERTTWQDILKFEEERLKYVEEQKRNGTPIPPNDRSS